MICDKTIYLTKAEAQKAIKGLQKDKRKRAPKKKVQKVYWCEPCNGYHITSHTARKNRGKFTNTEDLHIFVDKENKDRREHRPLIIQNFTSNPINMKPEDITHDKPRHTVKTVMHHSGFPITVFNQPEHCRFLNVD